MLAAGGATILITLSTTTSSVMSVTVTWCGLKGKVAYPSQPLCGSTLNMSILSILEKLRLQLPKQTEKQNNLHNVFLTQMTNGLHKKSLDLFLSYQ